MLLWIYRIVPLLCIHISFFLQPNSSKTFQNMLVIAIPFLSFKGIAYAYLPEISKTHNENQIP